jgi:protein KTI12
MPLLIICGKPGSGKTYRADELVSYYKQNHPSIEVVLINAEKFNINKENMYKTFAKEKELRAFFRSNINKSLTKDNLVIVDSLNYIKGLRYEMFCLARTAKSTYCVLYCDNDLNSCIEQNQKQENPQYKFSEDLLKDLFSRMEMPNSSKRWDSPLYTVWPHEELPVEAIHGSLFKDVKKMKDPVSTQMETKLDENYTYNVDKELNDLIKEVIKKINQNKQFLNQKTISVKRGNTEVSLNSKLTITKMKQAKTSFLKMNKNNPIKDSKKIAEAFLYFLQNAN